MPVEITLTTPYPNPFNATTSIAYSLPGATSVRLSIFDSNGQLVETLASGTQTAGSHNLIWNAGSRPAGIYLLKLETGSDSKTQKLILLK